MITDNVFNEYYKLQLSKNAFVAVLESRKIHMTRQSCWTPKWHVQQTAKFRIESATKTQSLQCLTTRVERYVSLVSLHPREKQRDTICRHLWNILYEASGKFRFAYAARRKQKRVMSDFIPRPSPFELSAAFCARLGFALQTTREASCLLRMSFGPIEVSKAHCARRMCRFASLEREEKEQKRQKERFRSVNH